VDSTTGQAVRLLSPAASSPCTASKWPLSHYTSTSQHQHLPQQLTGSDTPSPHFAHNLHVLHSSCHIVNPPQTQQDACTGNPSIQLPDNANMPSQIQLWFDSPFATTTSSNRQMLAPQTTTQQQVHVASLTVTQESLDTSAKRHAAAATGECTQPAQAVTPQRHPC
jgi:hypothetical protein